MLNVDLFTINVVHRMRFLYKTLPRRTEKKNTKYGKILEWKIPKANNMHLWCMCVNVRVFDGIWCVDKLRSSQHAAGCYNVITVQNWQTFVIAPFSSSNKQRPATSVPINTHNTFALWSNTSDLFPYFFIFFFVLLCPMSRLTGFVVASCIIQPPKLSFRLFRFTHRPSFVCMCLQSPHRHRCALSISLNMLAQHRIKRIQMENTRSFWKPQQQHTWCVCARFICEFARRLSCILALI